jgi:adenosine deaminase
MIIKAELHAHLEGTLTPQKVIDLARKNDIAVPEGILSADQKSYQWEDTGDAAEILMAFVTTYDRATAVIKTPEDYFDITLDYLKRCADEGSIYEELTIYADPEPFVGISYAAMLDGISDAIDTARRKKDIECRLLPAFVRHCGPEQALRDAVTVTKTPHKYVTGITMAGAESAFTVADFKPAYDMVTEKLNLPKTAHAGEATGPETIRACYEQLGITRFGHMVRVVEDPDLMQEMADIGAVAEVCPSSNIALKVYPDFARHPLRQMYEAGLNITLNSDDPPFFFTTLGQEYDIAARDFGFTDDQLTSFTQNALKAAFIDEPTREKLLQKI